MVSAPSRPAQEYLGFKPLKEPPGHYVRQNIYFSVQYKRVAIEQRHNVGVDHIMFATDFPHIENEWLNSRRVIDKIYADVPEDDKRKIWAATPSNSSSWPISPYRPPVPAQFSCYIGA